jgi:hypothetical protein
VTKKRRLDQMQRPRRRLRVIVEQMGGFDCPNPFCTAKVTKVNRYGEKTMQMICSNCEHGWLESYDEFAAMLRSSGDAAGEQGMDPTRLNEWAGWVEWIARNAPTVIYNERTRRTEPGIPVRLPKSASRGRS